MVGGVAVMPPRCAESVTISLLAKDTRGDIVGYRRRVRDQRTAQAKPKTGASTFSQNRLSNGD